MDVTARKSLPDPANKAAFVEAMFDRIAPRYDLLNRICTFNLDQRWRRRAVKLAEIKRHDTVLDLGCGTGDLAEMAAASGARVIGVDPSAGMLSGMKLRGIDARALRADAGCLPLPDNTASVVLSGFALRNFVSIESVFAEITRVLAPGGRIVIIEVDEPTFPPLRWLHDFHFRRIVPAIGRMVSDAEAYRYLPESTVYLPNPREMKTLMERVGWSDIRRIPLFGGVAQILFARRQQSI